ncbi:MULTISPECIES: FeoC-like transcriptional regulator [unclassified Zymobacter]|uniref:FeoC-like transcriptional regulator n=1 Tax=unclassified Zymobacter TaxID=3048685 RepID=UPI0039C21C15
MLALIEQLRNAPSGISAEALGKATGRPLPLVTAMLEHLERSGRIERAAVDSTCTVSKHCRHCPDSKGCMVPLFRLRT